MGKVKKAWVNICCIKQLVLLLVCWLPITVMAQLPTITATIDKKQLLIGEQTTLNIQASFPENTYSVNWFTLPDSLSHFELINAGNIDTLRSNGTIQLKQSLVFASFDSGSWATPPLAIRFQKQGESKPLTLYADTIPYQVSFIADTTAELKDIKPIIDVDGEAGWPWHYWVIAGVLLLVVLVLLSLLLYKLINKKSPMVVVGSQSPYQQVMKHLAALQQLNLALPTECRLYHTRLAQLFKEYMGYKLGVPLTNKTTSDTLLQLKDAGLSATILASTGAALRGCDAVKFAKFMPDAVQAKEWYNDIVNMIEQTERQPILKS